MSDHIVALRSVATPWDKLYKMDIIKQNDLYYVPEKELKEDIIFSLNYFHYVKKVRYIHHYGYNYRVLQNSFSHGFREDILRGDKRNLEEMYKYIEKIPEKEIKWKNAILQGVYVATIRFYIDEIKRWYFNSENKIPLSERMETLYTMLDDKYYSEAFQKVKAEDLSDMEREYLEMAKNKDVQGIYQKWERNKDF